MKYSYIKPRRKNIFSSELQLLFSFFSITLFMLFLTYLFLVFKDYRFSQEAEGMVNQKVELENSIADMKARITFIEKEVLLNERISTKNIVLKDSISNLFDLVPQRITLSEASLLKNGLILYGVTPNKDYRTAYVPSVSDRKEDSIYSKEATPTLLEKAADM